MVKKWSPPFWNAPKMLFDLRFEFRMLEKCFATIGWNFQCSRWPSFWPWCWLECSDRPREGINEGVVLSWGVDEGGRRSEGYWWLSRGCGNKHKYELKWASQWKHSGKIRHMWGMWMRARKEKRWDIIWMGAQIDIRWRVKVFSNYCFGILSSVNL